MTKARSVLPIVVVSFAASILVPAVLPSASLAWADASFQAAAQGARPVRHLEDLIWLATETCDKGDEVQQRQCRLVRDRRAKQLVGATYLVEAEPSALEVGKWSSAKKSVPVVLNGCVSCGGVKVYGKDWYVTGGTPHVEGAKLKPNPLYDNARKFADEAAANTWRTSVDRTRIELVVKLPDKARWQTGGKDGIGLEIVAYRVVAPCTGEVVIANPPSAPVEADKKACAK